MLLRCPWCGPRELEEFRFRSVLTGERAGPGESVTTGDHPSAAYARVYERANVPDSSVEYWQHDRGCRAWLVVQRNPSTAEVLDVQLLADRGAEP